MVVLNFRLGIQTQSLQPKLLKGCTVLFKKSVKLAHATVGDHDDVVMAIFSIEEGVYPL